MSNRQSLLVSCSPTVQGKRYVWASNSQIQTFHPISFIAQPLPSASTPLSRRPDSAGSDRTPPSSDGTSPRSSIEIKTPLMSAAVLPTIRHADSPSSIRSIYAAPDLGLEAGHSSTFKHTAPRLDIHSYLYEGEHWTIFRGSLFMPDHKKRSVVIKFAFHLNPLDQKPMRYEAEMHERLGQVDDDRPIPQYYGCYDVEKNSALSNCQRWMIVLEDVGESMVSLMDVDETQSTKILRAFDRLHQLKVAYREIEERHVCHMPGKDQNDRITLIGLDSAFFVGSTSSNILVYEQALLRFKLGVSNDFPYWNVDKGSGKKSVGLISRDEHRAMYGLPWPNEPPLLVGPRPD